LSARKGKSRDQGNGRNYTQKPLHDLLLEIKLIYLYPPLLGNDDGIVRIWLEMGSIANYSLLIYNNPHVIVG
jgi:hypothetical protein